MTNVERGAIRKIQRIGKTAKEIQQALAENENLQQAHSRNLVVRGGAEVCQFFLLGQKLTALNPRNAELSDRILIEAFKQLTKDMSRPNLFKLLEGAADIDWVLTVHAYNGDDLPETTHNQVCNFFDEVEVQCCYRFKSDDNQN